MTTSDFEIFSPNLGAYVAGVSEPFEVDLWFSFPLSRSVHFTYEKEVTLKDIKLYRVTIPDEVLKSGDVYPPNRGFCVSPGCLPTGLLNISLCQPMSELLFSHLC